MKKIIVIALISLVLILALGGYFFLPQLFLPKLEGQLELKGLEHPVTVVRDRYGVPHIRAQSKKDLFLAFGYVAAQDRLFQMDLIRRTGGGELSEIFGKRTLEIDKLLRTLRIHRSAKETYERFKTRYDPEMISLVEAYLQGIDQFVKNDKLPLEFSLLRYKPKSFTLIDMLSVPGYMALSFAEPIETDPVISLLAKKLPPSMMDDLRLEAKTLPQKSNVAKVSLSEPLKELQNYIPMFHGSNAWGLSSKRSRSGKPLLANDPHIAFSNPSIWYEAHLSAPGYEVYGYYLPLIPFPALGQNNEAAWTVTMSEVDDMDLYEETFSSQDPLSYYFKDQWLKAKEEKERILIKGEKPFDFSVVSTLHGPLIDQTTKGISGKHLALKWSYHHPENDALTTFYQLHQAKTVDQFKTALSHAGAPGLNMIFANSKGDLAQWVMGKIPRRPKEMSSDRILDGESGKEEYPDYLSIEENPHQINPPSGQIVTTNWRPDGRHNLNGFWQPIDRYERLQDRLKTKELWSLEEMKVIQNDTYAQFSPQLVKALLSSVKPLNNKEEQILKILKDWDGFASVESVGATIFYVWSQKNFKILLVDDLGEEGFKSYCKAPCWHFYKKVMMNPKSLWWKNEREKRLRLGFENMQKFLSEKLGEEPSSWQWGRLHTLTFEHPLGKAKFLAPFLNLGPYPVSGANNVVNNMGHTRSGDSYDVKLGPSTRRLIDLANLNQMMSIIPTGNSGNRFSENYNNQVEAYLRGEYRVVKLQEPEGPLKTLQFVP